MSAQLRHMATDKMGVALTRVSFSSSGLYSKISHLSSINSPFSLRQPGMLFILSMHWLDLATIISIQAILGLHNNYNLYGHALATLHFKSTLKHGCTISYKCIYSSPVFQSDLLLNFSVLHFRFHIDNTSVHKRKGINVECNIYNLLLY